MPHSTLEDISSDKTPSIPTENETVQTRVCTQCDEAKPLAEYSKQKNVKSGLKAKYKSCIKENMKQYNAKKKAEKTIIPSPSISPSNVLVTINYIMAIGQLSAERKIAIIKELVK